MPLIKQNMTDDQKLATDIQSRPLPRLLLYSKAGAIPYLDSNFVLKNDGVIFRDDEENQKEQRQLTTLFIGDLYDLHMNGVLNQFPKMSYFANANFLVTLSDPLVASYQDLKSTPAAVPLITYHGKRMFTVEQLLDIVRQTGAVAFQSLADINTPPTAGKKWTTKAATRSVAMLEEVLEKRGRAAEVKNDEGDQSTKRLKTSLEESKSLSSVWATCSGGYSARDRTTCCKAISDAHANNLLAGVVIDGFFGYHTTREVEVEGEEGGKGGHRRDVLEVVDQLTAPITKLIKEVVLPALPPALPRYLPGALLPDDMLRAVGQLGIDSLDSSIASLLTAAGVALPSPLIDLAALRLRFSRHHQSSTNEDGSSPSPASPPSPSPSSSSPTWLLDLTGEEHRRSAMAISGGCDCHTCQNGYSRAYINHLLRRHELNGSMLLQAHNHWALTVFFAHLRRLTREEKMEGLLRNSGLLEEEEKKDGISSS